MFTTIELNQLMRLDGEYYKIVPFHYTHLKFMEFREAEKKLFDSFHDYAERIKTFPMHGLSFSGMVGKKIVCCFGLLPIWEGVYEAWLIPCLQIGEHKFKFHKSSLRFFNYAAKKLNIHRLKINVNRYNYLAYKWAMSCYFQNEGLLKGYGPDKSDYFMMSRLFGIKEKE